MRTVRLLAAVIALAVAATPVPGQAKTDETAKVLAEMTLKLAEQGRELARLRAIVEGRQGAALDQEAVLATLSEMNADAAGRSLLPAWLEALTFFGDLRLQYWGEVWNTGAKNRNRLRFRLRFGIRKYWLDKQLEIGFRLASGSDDVPTSTNQTFTGHFTTKNIWIDRAYAKYKPNWLKGLMLIGGKMANPFVHTDLVWDTDVNPEGFWGEYRLKVCSAEPFVGVGYFIMNESGGAHDTILVGGVLAAGQFHVINLTNIVGFEAFGLPMKAYFDWVHNCGDEDNDEDWDCQDTAYAVGLKIGKNKKKGDLSFSYKYAYIEANATPGALNDALFESSNRKGHV